MEVVFSDSTKAALYHASKRDARFGDVVSVGFNLDVGEISDGELTGAQRIDAFVRLFASVKFKDSEVNEFFQSQKVDTERLLNAAKNKEPIRIWVSNAAFSQCGYHCVCHLIRDIDCPLSRVDLPRYWTVSENTIQTLSSWQEISDERFAHFLNEERAIPYLEKMIRADIWQELCCENSPLRAVINGDLVSAPEEFYDFIILNEMPQDAFLMARLIGEILGKYPLGVADGWYAMRLRSMRDAGLLEETEVRDKNHPYGVVLRATEKLKQRLKERPSREA